jgi:hypothetical protein
VALTIGAGEAEADAFRALTIRVVMSAAEGAEATTAAVGAAMTAAGVAVVAAEDVSDLWSTHFIIFILGVLPLLLFCEL